MKITTNAFIFFENKLLVVHHRKLGFWLHPGGHVDEGESFLNALLREIKEEVGLDVLVISNDCFKTKKYNHVKDEPVPFRVSFSESKKAIRLDYIAKAHSNIITLQKKELLDYKWIDKREIDTLNTTPLFKELANQAFQYFESIKHHE